MLLLFPVFFFSALVLWLFGRFGLCVRDFSEVDFNMNNTQFIRQSLDAMEWEDTESER